MQNGTLRRPTEVSIVAKKTDRATDQPKKRPKKGTTWDERREYIISVAIARDLGEWLQKIAARESSKLPEGRLSAGELIDPLLREWAWQEARPILERDLGVDLPEQPPAPPGPFAVPDGREGWIPPAARK